MQIRFVTANRMHFLTELLSFFVHCQSVQTSGVARSKSGVDTNGERGTRAYTGGMGLSPQRGTGAE